MSDGTVEEVVAKTPRTSLLIGPLTKCVAWNGATVAEIIKELPKNWTAKLSHWDEKRKCWWRKRWETEPTFVKRDFTIW